MAKTDFLHVQLPPILAQDLRVIFSGTNLKSKATIHLMEEFVRVFNSLTGEEQRAFLGALVSNQVQIDFRIKER